MGSAEQVPNARRGEPSGRLRRRLTGPLCAGLLALALVVTLTPFTLAGTAGFPDVPETHPYSEAVDYLVVHGVIDGYPNGDFGPDDEVTRQQFAKMVVLAGGYQVSENDVCPFVDVLKGGSDTLYPDNCVAVCAAQGITIGRTPSLFDPYSNITRLQAISMVVRAADDLQPGLLAVPPEDSMGTVAWTADPTHGANASRAEYNGLLAGLDLGTLSPTGNMTRGEVAQVLYNLIHPVVPPTTTTLPATTTTESTATSSTESTTTTTGCG